MYFFRSAVVCCAAIIITNSTGLLAGQGKSEASAVEARIQRVENSMIPGTVGVLVALHTPPR